MVVEAQFHDPIWATLQSLPTALAYWNRSLICQFANRAHAEWFHIKSSQMVDLHFSDLVGEKRATELMVILEKVLAGEAQEYEVELVRPDGSRRPSLIRYTPHIVDGRVLGFIAEAINVSHMHRMRSNLAQALERQEEAERQCRLTHKALIKAQQLAQIGSWEWEIDSDVVKWSEQLYAIFGFDPKLPPPSFAEHDRLYSADSMAKLSQAVALASSAGAPYCLELEYFDKAGRRGWLEGRGQAVRDEDGRIIGLHGTVQEITARHTARQVPAQERRIAELEAQLASEVKMRKAVEIALQTAEARLAPPSAQPQSGGVHSMPMHLVAKIKPQ